MKKYKIIIEEILREEIVVFSEDRDSALESVLNSYKEGEFELTKEDNLYDTDYDIFEEE